MPQNIKIIPAADFLCFSWLFIVVIVYCIETTIHRDHYYYSIINAGWPEESLGTDRCVTNLA